MRLPGPQTPSFWNLSHWWGLLFSVPPNPLNLPRLPAPVYFLDDWWLHFKVLSGSLSSSAFYFILGSCLQSCLVFTFWILPHLVVYIPNSYPVVKYEVAPFNYGSFWVSNESEGYFPPSGMLWDEFSHICSTSSQSVPGFIWLLHSASEPNT